MATKKTARNKAGESAAAGKKTVGGSGVKNAAAPGSMPKAGKDAKGGLTATGRAYFAAKEGAHLRPGVQGPADTPEKMVRKGSFLRRHFANPQGPMKDDKGEPTRLALSAHAWGEAVPETMSDARKLADEGHELLERYHESQDEAKKGKSTKAPVEGRKAGGGKKVASKSAAKKSVANKSVVKTAAAKRVVAKKTAVKKAGKGSVGVE